MIPESTQKVKLLRYRDTSGIGSDARRAEHLRAVRAIWDLRRRRAGAAGRGGAQPSTVAADRQRALIRHSHRAGERQGHPGTHPGRLSPVRPADRTSWYPGSPMTPQETPGPAPRRETGVHLNGTTQVASTGRHHADATGNLTDTTNHTDLTRAVVEATPTNTTSGNTVVEVPSADHRAGHSPPTSRPPTALAQTARRGAQKAIAVMTPGSRRVLTKRGLIVSAVVIASCVAIAWSVWPGSPTVAPPVGDRQPGHYPPNGVGDRHNRTDPADPAQPEHQAGRPRRPPPRWW
jgi:hypothetical protein